MTTRHTAAFLGLALATAVNAAAQTPVPKPVPNPDPVIVPQTVITPKIVTLPDMPIVIDMPQVRLDMDAIKLATMGAQDAMDKARIALLDSKLDLIDWQGGQGAGAPLGARRGTEGSYNAGLSLITARKYDEAIVQFDRVVAQKAANADGALYWKAYSQFKLGKTDDSVATIAALRKDFAQSRWLGDAKVLEADAKRRAGQPVSPSAIDDDEIKMLALNALKNTDPERAIPLLEGVLSATNSLQFKKRAIYILASIPNQPKARQILMNYAKGAGNPDLQIEAIRYVTAGGDKSPVTSAELMQIYESTQDTAVRMAVINALGNSGGRNQLYAIAGSANTPIALRSSALKGTVLTPAELWTLYEKETNKELKLQIAGILGSMGANDYVTRIIKSEKDQDVVRRAIRSLGNQPVAKTGPMLVDLYTTDQDQARRLAVIAALGNQENAEGLVAIARKEASLTLKKEIVRELSDMAPKSKVATDYLMEIIK